LGTYYRDVAFVAHHGWGRVAYWKKKVRKVEKQIMKGSQTDGDCPSVIGSMGPMEVTE